MLGVMTAIYLAGALIELGLIASQTKLTVLYIGFPVVFLALTAIGFPVGVFFIRLSRSRFDKRLISFAESGSARFVNEWLTMVAMNFAHREGHAERWYHYLPKGVMNGKFG